MVNKLKPKGFAAGTKVPVEKTRTEIETLLKKHGASAFFSSSDDTRGVAVVGFRLAGRLFRLEVRVPLKTQAPPMKFNRRTTLAMRDARVAEWIKAEERRRWRVQLLNVKAKLETVATGETTVEREFLADMIVPGSSQTVGQQAIPALMRAYTAGVPVSLLALGSGDGS